MSLENSEEQVIKTHLFSSSLKPASGQEAKTEYVRFAFNLKRGSNGGSPLVDAIVKVTLESLGSATPPKGVDPK
jgi:hypothetical protein